MSLQGSLSIERMCYLAQVSRAGFYRSLAGAFAGRRRDGGTFYNSTDRCWNIDVATAIDA